MKNKFDKTMINSAKLWAKQSYCTKKQVGAVLANDGRIIATGYNGTVARQPNVCEIDGKTSEFTVHAEQNVLSYCAKTGIPSDGATMYITLSPCATCAKFMVQSGIKRVVYLEEYKDLSGIEFLTKCGIEVVQFKED